jgi:glycosyltransferase involved in cell wall biosynthesis
LAECGNCPQLNENRSESDLSHQNWQIKSKSLAGKAIHVAACCSWLEDCARKSSLFTAAKTFQTIHNGVDLRSFYPSDRAVARQALSVDANAFVIAFGAQSIVARGKGFETLFAALKLLPDAKIVVLLFGKGQPKDLEELPHVNFKLLGHVDSADFLDLIYSAADVFLLPSLYESLAQTSLEAMACSIPVIGSAVGGTPEMVQPGTTGMLVPPANPGELATAIRWMIEHPEERAQMGANARKLVETRFSSELQVKKYIDLYEALASHL